MVEFVAIVAVAEFPEHAADVPELVIYPAPLVIALLFSDMFAVPSNDTPAIVRAFANAVAVAALPVQDPEEPDALPVRFPTNAPCPNVIPAAAMVAVVVPSMLAIILPVPLSSTLMLVLPSVI
tara:strand:+ start:97 stop:465 length:369 start_codon:yes stop_codon:yes gene_type:complete